MHRSLEMWLQGFQLARSSSVSGCEWGVVGVGAGYVIERTL